MQDNPEFDEALSADDCYICWVCLACNAVLEAKSVAALEALKLSHAVDCCTPKKRGTAA